MNTYATFSKKVAIYIKFSSFIFKNKGWGRSISLDIHRKDFHTHKKNEPSPCECATVSKSGTSLVNETIAGTFPETHYEICN